MLRRGLRKFSPGKKQKKNKACRCYFVVILNFVIVVSFVVIIIIIVIVVVIIVVGSVGVTRALIGKRR